METTKAERRQIFWNVSLNGYEKRVLKEAGFHIPEQLLDLPVVYLVHLEYFGFTYTVDVLEALCEYFELPEDEFPEIVEKLMDVLSDIEYKEEYYDADCIDHETQMLIMVDDIFYSLGYTDNELISQLTIKDLLNIKGVDMPLISYMAKEIVTTYYKTYVVPKCKFKSRDDFKLNGRLLFEHLK